MKALLELHILQNFAPSNLNRDDTGSPKDAYFGGVRRARVSSQSFKRAMRMDFKDREILKPEELGERSKRFLEQLSKNLIEHGGFSREESRFISEAVLSLNGVFFIEKKPSEDDLEEYPEEYPVELARSEALAFLSNDMLNELTQYLSRHREAALSAAKVMQDFRVKRRKTKGYKGGVGEDKKDLRKKVHKAFGEQASEISKVIDGLRAVDVALFGRMLADLPDKNADAAAQVAHALGTHAANREFDFYTAVDDLKPSDTAGADMLGTVEFGSATFYRYAAVDLAKLRENLGGDTELALRGLRAFLTAAVYALPGGKQNTFAAHNLPSLFATAVREDASPRNLANAFEVPVRAGQKSVVEGSMARLAEEWGRQERVFGQPGRGRYVNARDERDLAELPGERLPSIEALLDATLDDAARVLNGLPAGPR